MITNLRVDLRLKLYARLTRFSVLTMSGLVQLQASGWPGAGVTIVGDVDIVQRQPLAHRGRDDRFTAPPIPYDSEDPEDFLISKILQDYAERFLLPVLKLYHYLTLRKCFQERESEAV